MLGSQANRSRSILNSIFEDILSKYPSTSTQVIVQALLQLTITEILPKILFRVQLPILDPFEKKANEFRNQRRRKDITQKSDTVSGDIRAIVTTAKSFLSDSIITPGVSNDRCNFVHDIAFMEDYDILSASDTFGSEINENRLGFLSAGHVRQGETILDIAKTSVKDDIYTMAPELNELRDTSMIKGRFFSVIEREVRKFALNEQIPITLKLEKQSINNADYFVLNVNCKRYTLKEKTDHLIASLKQSLLERLSDTLVRLENFQRSEFKSLIDKFEIHPQTKTILVENDLYELTSLKKIKEKRQLGFEDIREIFSLLEVTVDRFLLRKISELLEQEIRLRDRIYKSSCIKELYEDEKFIPPKFHLEKPQSRDLKGRIKQALRAIVLNEYKLCCNVESTKLLDKQVSYRSYLETTNQYTKLVIELW